MFQRKQSKRGISGGMKFLFAVMTVSFVCTAEQYGPYGQNQYNAPYGQQNYNNNPYAQQAAQQGQGQNGQKGGSLPQSVGQIMNAVAQISAADSAAGADKHASKVERRTTEHVEDKNAEVENGRIKTDAELASIQRKTDLAKLARETQTRLDETRLRLQDKAAERQNLLARERARIDDQAAVRSQMATLKAMNAQQTADIKIRQEALNTQIAIALQNQQQNIRAANTINPAALASRQRLLSTVQNAVPGVNLPTGSSASGTDVAQGLTRGTQGNTSKLGSALYGILSNRTVGGSSRGAINVAQNKTVASANRSDLQSFNRVASTLAQQPSARALVPHRSISSVTNSVPTATIPASSSLMTHSNLAQ